MLLLSNYLHAIYKSFVPIRKFLLLDLGFNSLGQIQKNCFASLWLLQTLIVNDNQINFIETGSFYNLTNLKLINLSNNPLIKQSQSIFKTSVQLKLFYVTNVNFMDIDIHAIQELSVKVIITTDYHLCCISSKDSVCPTHKPWYISCSHILPKENMKNLYISVSTVAIALNFTSILIHFVTRKGNKPYSVTVVSINLTDVLFGVYYACIRIADIVFKDRFLVKEMSWRSGTICFVAFGTLLWFTILSQLLLVFLSLSRLMVVIYPIQYTV